MTYTLYFENSRGQRRVVATYESKNANAVDAICWADDEIRAFCEDHHFKIYYTRVWNNDADNETCFDVGSHTEFFYVQPAFNYHVMEELNDKDN